MCNYNIESKQVPEKKATCFELILLLAVGYYKKNQVMRLWVSGLHGAYH